MGRRNTKAKFELRNCDAKDIFTAACNFELALAKLQKATNDAFKSIPKGGTGQPFRLYESIAVNAAMSTELFLKCLLQIDLGGWTNGHNHVQLFRELSVDRQKEIRRYHDNYMETDLEQIRRANWNSQMYGLPPSKLDFDSQLNEKKNAFIHMRYWFERPESRLEYKTLGYPDTVARSVRNVILKVRPEWEDIAITLT
jgi:hypothetical protein|tara:strand:+ start:311 stop:904 length:594 start_codon:yes stop_codon:yes gene_type:complete